MQVQQLLSNIRQARTIASGYRGEPAGGSTSSNDSGLMGLLGFGPMMDYNASRYLNASGGEYEDFGGGGDFRKLEVHLEQAAANLAHIFQVRLSIFKGEERNIYSFVWKGEVLNFQRYSEHDNHTALLLTP